MLMERKREDSKDTTHNQHVSEAGGGERMMGVGEHYCRQDQEDGGVATTMATTMGRQLEGGDMIPSPAFDQARD